MRRLPRFSNRLLVLAATVLLPLATDAKAQVFVGGPVIVRRPYVMARPAFVPARPVFVPARPLIVPARPLIVPTYVAPRVVVPRVYYGR